MGVFDNIIGGIVGRKLLAAPNGGRKKPADPLPRPVPFDHVTAFEVGPPHATLVCWTLHPRRWTVRIVREREARGRPDQHHPPLPPSASGENLRAELVPGDLIDGPARGTVFMLHGWRDSVLEKAYLRPLACALADAGFRVVLPDMRGHGQSTGEFITYGLLERWDLIRLIDAFRTNELAGERVALFGFSYGGNVSLLAAAEDRRIAGVIAASAPHNLRAVLPASVKAFKPRLSWLVSDAALDQSFLTARKRTGLDLYESSAERAIKRTDAPVLLVHGERDEKIPLAASHRIRASRPAGTSTLYLPGEMHSSYFGGRFPLLRDSCIDHLGEWFGKN